MSLNQILDHPAIVEALDRNHNFELKRDWLIMPDGFSKSGTCYFSMGDEGLEALTQYGRVDQIENYNDIVLLALSWWRNSFDQGFTSPPTRFIKDFEERKLIIAQTQTFYRPV